MPVETGNPYGVQAVGGNNRAGTFVDPDLASAEAMDDRLQAIDSGYYTDARLNTMTYNDKVYAIRQADNPTKIR